LTKIKRYNINLVLNSKRIFFEKFGQFAEAGAEYQPKMGMINQTYNSAHNMKIDDSLFFFLSKSYVFAK